MPWVPGDPLWVHPYRRTDMDAQAVRYMYDLVDDVSYARGSLAFAHWYCSRCEVFWGVLGGKTCWFCGEKGEEPRMSRYG